MGKIYTAIGLMSGTSLDGVDVSIIETDGNKEFASILDNKYLLPETKINKIEILFNKIKND